MERMQYSEPQKTQSKKEAWLAELNSDTTISYIKDVIRHTDTKIQNADVEDIAQDILIQANKALDADKFKGQSSLKTWIFRIATNKAIEYFRKKTRAGKTFTNALPSGFEPASGTPNPEELLIERQRIELTERASHLLTKVEKRVFDLKMKGLTNEEISKETGASTATIRVTIHRIKEKLKETLT